MVKNGSTRWGRASHEIGPASGQDRVDLIRRGDVADAHGGHMGLVAHLVGEWRLEHAPVDRPRLSHGLSRRDVDEVHPMFGEGAGDCDGIPAVTPPSAQSVAEMRTDIGLWAGQTSRMASNTSSGKRRRFSRSRHIRPALVRERRQEARHQVAVGAMEFQHVEPGPLAALAASTNCALMVSMSARVISRGTWLSGK